MKPCENDLNESVCEGGGRHASLCKVGAALGGGCSGLMLSVKSSCKNSLGSSIWQEVKFEFIWRCVIIILEMCTPIAKKYNSDGAVYPSFLFSGCQFRSCRYKRATHVFIWMKINYTAVNNWYKGEYICQVRIVHWLIKFLCMFQFEGRIYVEKHLW